MAGREYGFRERLKIITMQPIELDISINILAFAIIISPIFAVAIEDIIQSFRFRREWRER